MTYRYCDGIKRRDLLRVGALGFLGLTLSDFLRLRAEAATPEARERSCILLWMGGGPSHVDTFDPKPDAPSEYRGPFQVIATRANGVQVSEHLPLLAQQMDKLAIVRSVTSPEGSHERATHYLLTGYRLLPSLEFPGYGSVVAREAGFGKRLPPYVAVPDLIANAESGYLGATYNPFAAGDPGVSNYTLRDTNLPGGVTAARLDRRRAFLKSIDAYPRSGRPAEPIRALDRFYERAYDLVTSPEAKKAFDLSQEPAALRDAYGRNTFGQGCLLARRLVESGVRFVTVSRGGWDTHSRNFDTLQRHRLPELDRGFATLLRDLHDRGLLASTLVVWMGEFGRTPKINDQAGRDHWPKAMSVCFAGGGVKGGRVVGATDARAEAPAERPVTPEDLAATIYALLGIDVNRVYTTPSGRPVRAVSGGSTIQELV